MPLEVIVDWTTPAGSGFVSVLYFDSATANTVARNDVGDWLGTTDTLLSNATHWSVRPDTRLLDDATGTLVGAGTDGTIYSGTGNGASGSVPDAAQVLIRWSTNTIINGRFLKGRTYIPGCGADLMSNGNVSSAGLTGFNTEANDFITASPTFGVWHRPVSGSGGQFVAADGASVWSEFAVLRGRRQ